MDGCTDLKAVCHPMDSCNLWNNLSVKEREAKAKCLKHPFKTDHTTAECTVSGKKCKHCSKDTHHFLFCPTPKKKTSSNIAKVILICSLR